jgi:plasmid stabilization system protein ParE
MEALFHPDARAELLDAATYYEERADGLGGPFIDEAHRVVDLLVGSPGLGAPVAGQPALRRWRMRRFPYYVIYREQGKQLYVLAVAHERRRPGYWSDRQEDGSPAT